MLISRRKIAYAWSVGKRAQSLAKMLSSNEIAFQETTAANGISLSPYYHETCSWTAVVSYSVVSFLFSFIFPLFVLLVRLQVVGTVQRTNLAFSVFIRELNVEHSFFNERFAILILRINLAVSRHRELRVKGHRVCAARVYLYIYLSIYICIYIYR